MDNVEKIDLTKMKLAQLREIGGKLNISDFAKLRKQELIDAITVSKDEVKENDNTENNNMEFRSEVLRESEILDGILEVMPDGYGFLRAKNFLPSDNDIFVPPAQIKRFRLKTGDHIIGNVKKISDDNKYRPLLYVQKVNNESLDKVFKRKNFDDLTPIFPNEKFQLTNNHTDYDTRMIDIFAPIGKGQRSMIVSPPKAGKTMLLKKLANSILGKNENANIIILLIDERPEEVTDIKESIVGDNVDVIYSTFDEHPEHHKRAAEMVYERAKRLVEFGKDVVILLDSITRLARAYNLIVPSSGKTLSGGLDPASLHMPKKFFGLARNIREGGSITIISTALVDTGSKMDDVIFEEFKGTGNMELILDRRLSQRRIYPSIDIVKSSTRNDNLLLSLDEQKINTLVYEKYSHMNSQEMLETMIKLMKNNKTNKTLLAELEKSK